MVKYLLECGANVQAENRNSEVPIHMAARQNNINIIHLIICSCGNVNNRDTNGYSPIHHAAFEDHINGFQTLQTLGCYPNQANVYGIRR